MYLLKRGIDAVSSATTSTRTRLSQLEAKASTTQNDLVKQHAIANEMIKIAPTSLKGYLLAGRIYLKQKNLEAALAVYKQGLEFVPNIVPSYSLLHRNYDAVQTELIRRKLLQQQPSASIHHQQQDVINQQDVDTTTTTTTISVTFAYDIISLIFGHLSVNDLIKCITVCESWRQFIIKWPAFWQLITAELPQLDLNSFTMYLVDQHRGLKFLEPQQQQQQHQYPHAPRENNVLSPNALSFISALRDYHYPLEALFIENMVIDSDAWFLLNVLQPHSLKSIELYNVYLSTNSLLGSIVLGCHEADRIVFRAPRSTTTQTSNSDQYFLPTAEEQQQNKNVNNDGSTDLSSVINSMGSSFLGMKEFNRIADTFSFEITYLDISLGGRSPATTPLIYSDGKLLNDIIRRCSKLEYLFLDSRDAVCHGQLISTITDCCPRIKTFVLNDSCTMPKTVKINDNSSETSNSTSTVSTNGLRQFVMASSSSYTSGQVHTLVQKNQSTIELLFLHYDGYVILSEFLCRLADQVELFPQLRELTICTTSDFISRTRTTSAFSDTLSAFLLRCPVLQALTIIDRSSSPTAPLVTDSVLRSLAYHCTDLQYLRVNSRRSFTAQGLSQLASAASVVKTLDLDFMRRDLVPVISQWQTLKHVVLRTNTQHPMSHADIAMYRLVEAALRQRNGTFHRKSYR